MTMQEDEERKWLSNNHQEFQSFKTFAEEGIYPYN